MGYFASGLLDGLKTSRKGDKYNGLCKFVAFTVKNVYCFKRFSKKLSNNPTILIVMAVPFSNCLIIFTRRFKKLDGKYKNIGVAIFKIGRADCWSNCDQSFVKYATEGGFGLFTEPLVELLQQSARPILKIPTPIFFICHLVS
jgi:hypothetical protein